MRKFLPPWWAGLLLAGRLLADPIPAPSAPPAPAPDAAAEPTAKADSPGLMLYPRTAAPVLPARASAAMGGTTLTLLIALLGAAGGWLLWKKLRTVRETGPGRLLAISETRSLGNRQFLVVAAYGERKFLLGVCPGRIDLLSPLDENRTPPQ